MKNEQLPAPSFMRGASWITERLHALRLSGNNYNYLKFTFVSVLFCLAYVPYSANAQYADVPVTGFNADVVADGAVGPAINSTNADVDGVNYAFVSTTFAATGTTPCTTGANAMPASNQITSLITPALTYNIQPYAGNNVLRLAAGTTGTFTVTTPRTASNLYLLSTGGSGACNLSVTVTFTDATTQVFTGTVNDWCSGVTPATVQYYRIINTSTTCNGAGCQYMYELNFALSAANYSKNIASVQIQNLTGSGVLNAFALGAKAPCAVPAAQATNLSSGIITTGSIAASFTDATTIPSGGYLVVRYPQGAVTTAPAAGTLYTVGQALGLGTVVSSALTTSFATSGLTGSTSYDFYVYAYSNGTTCGGPVYLTTTPLTATLTTTACGTTTGTIQIGAGLPNTLGGGFSSISNALAAINTGGIGGNTILALQANYDGTAPNETFPIVFPYNACVSATKTITIRPATGVSSPIIITSDSTTTININGGSYITFDGRPGGVGTTSMLQIINKKATGAAIQFINDAHHNTIRYCDVQGQNTSATSSALSGVIYFAGTTTPALNGNDNNTIANCDIHATVTDFPAIAVCSYGNNVATPVSSWNDSNTITNCNIYDFYSATLASTAVKLDGGSHAFTISNNKVYQTATRNYTTSNQHRAFWLTPTATGACGFQVINNFIGGDNATGTGVWTLTSNASVLTNFWGMDINHSGLGRTSVQGNTITNIALNSNTTTANDLFRGISTGGTGNMDIGTIAGNTIGAATGTGAILLNTTANSSISYGIKVGSTVDTINVYNNTIGGITLSSATATNALNFHGIGVTSSAYTNIIGNKIGSLTTPLSINSVDSATTTQLVYGISVVSGTYTTINNNSIVNLNNNYKSNSTGYTRGIMLTTSTTSVITGNSIRNISTASTYTGTGTTAALVGIQMSSANPSTVTNNIVDSLVLTNPSIGIASSVEGIVFSSNGATPTNLVTRNFIHSLDVTADNASALMVGIDILGGSNIIANNIVRLGIKSDGTSIPTSMVMRGIYIGTTTAENIYHNSVYIGGTSTGTTTANTAAFFRNTSVLGSQHDIRNNIFVNERSNATTGGKHYQMYLNNTIALSLGTNNYYGTGTGSVFGTLNGGTSDALSYASGWLTTDVGSSISNPRFITPAGSAATVNLHINATTPTPIESTGLLLSTIVDDYDGQTRSSSTPVDIGADGGNFTPLPMSIDSTVVDQNTAFVPRGTSNQYIARIRVYAKDNFSPLQLTSFVLNTIGTTSLTDIANAKVFSTGANSTFATTTQYGTTVAAPSGAFSIAGTTTLTAGVNYFWVTYDITNTAVLNNNADVRLDNILFSTTTSPAILNGNPAGARGIKAPLSGTYTVGAGQTYTTIAAAMADLNSLGVNAPVVLSLTDILYTLTDSVYIGSIPGTSATNTVTMRPAAANLGATITSSSTTSTFEMMGVSYFIMDGRPGGTTSPIAVPNTTNLNIINTSVTGSAIRLNNDAQNNTIKYCDLQGVNNVSATLQGTSAGVVFIGLTSGTLGNDNNTIDNCNIHSTVNTAVLTMGVYSSGPPTSSSLIATFNDNNTVSNCNIYDMYGGVNLFTGGIVLDRGTNAWTMTGNSFFQTATRTPVLTASIANRGIYIAPTNSTGVGNGFTITGNYFGGTQPLCGGTPLTSTTTGSFNNLTEGIYISVNGGTTTNIKGNTFTNLNISQAASASDLYHAVWINHNGNINVGGPLPSDGNIVGSSTTTGAITLASAGTSITPSHMILIAGNGGANSSTNILIQNNKIGGITLTGSGNAFSGIYVSGGSTVTVDNNLIGSTTVPNSINANNAGTIAAFVRGINVPSAANVLTITNNIIANLNNNNTSVTGGTNGTSSNISQTNGIYLIGTSTAGPIVTGNTIKNLSGASAMTSTGTAACVNGIAVANTTAITPAIISSNKVDSLFATATSTTAAIAPVGIVYHGPTAAVNTVAKNYVNNIDLSVANTGALIRGIELTAGAVNVVNNMVRLGIHADGSDLTTALVITGIFKSGTGNNKFYHNSVYIGGAGVGSTTAKNTAAFQRTGTGVDDIRNNIFVNNRSNATTGSKHYQLLLNAPTTLTVNNNVYFGTGTGAVFASANGTVDTVVYKAGWIVGDLNSIVGNPQFIGAIGPSATADLHIHATNPTPVEAGGTLISLVTDDYDGQTRSTNTPVDIGADGGNFVQSDLVGPTIGAFTVTNTSSTANRVIAVGLSDISGVAVGGNAPRIYYYKSSAGVPGGYSSSAGVLASGTAQNGLWNFTIVSGDMSGLLLNDSVYYYISAQDASSGSYFSSAPAGATNSGATPPPTLLSYKIVQGYSGNINVGVGQTFTSLTAIGGVFDSINKGSLSGNVTLTVTSDLLLEDGTVPLTQWAESGAGNYTVSIVPNSATERLIAGTVATAGLGMIRFDGADRVKIDGRFAGAGRYLRFRNRAQAGTTFTFLNDAHRDTLTYCFIEGINNNNALGVILFSTTALTTGSGNDSNGINNCFIGDTLGSVANSNRPTTMIGSAGTANFENSENSFVNNNIYNYTTYGISITATGNGSNWNITGNSFYNTMPTPVAIGQTTINFLPGVFSVNNKITGNYIGGGAPLCAGTAFVNSGNVGWKCISVNVGTADSSYIQNNTLQNITLSGPGAGSFTGIEILAGLTSISANTIGHNTTANSIQTPLLGSIVGILINGTTDIAQVYDNLIGNITTTGITTAMSVNGIRISSANTNFPLGVRGNVIKNMTAAGTLVSTFTPAMAGIVSTYSGVQQNISGNLIFNLTNTGAAVATSVLGIDISNSLAAGTISNNWVYGLNNTSNNNTAQVVGVYLDFTFGVTVVNNMVSLGYNVDSASIIAGIMDKSTGINNLIYYNTVLVSGTQTVITAGASQAYRRTTTSGTIVRNNIFNNTRTGGSANYAIGNTSTTPGSGWVANYNAFSSAIASQIGLWSTSPTTLAAWKTTSLFDTNSVSFAANFVTNTDLHLTTGSTGNSILAGRPIAGFTTDFDAQVRSTTFPYIGADEKTNPIPVKLMEFAATAKANDVSVYWTTASEINNRGFEIERSVDGDKFAYVDFVKGADNSSTKINYQFTDAKAFEKTVSKQLYYRLKQIDMDGQFVYSPIVIVQLNTDEDQAINVSPNPFVNGVNIIFASEKANGKATITVTNIAGKTVHTETVTTTMGKNNSSINLQSLQSGVYFISIEVNGERKNLKLLKN